MRDFHPYAYEREHEAHPAGELLLGAVGLLAVTLLLVWAAGQVSGRLWLGAWPKVPLAGAGPELVQLWRHPGDPPAGTVPGGAAYFCVLGTLVLLVGGLAIALLRLVRPRQRRWIPPLPLSSSSHEPFLRVYRRGRASRPR